VHASLNDFPNCMETGTLASNVMIDITSHLEELPNHCNALLDLTRLYIYETSCDPLENVTLDARNGSLNG
jgi:hypothetical protein